MQSSELTLCLALPGYSDSGPIALMKQGVGPEAAILRGTAAESTPIPRGAPLLRLLAGVAQFQRAYSSQQHGVVFSIKCTASIRV